MRFDHLIELLQDCLGVTGDDDDILAKGDDVGNHQSSNDDSAILPVADRAGYSNAEWIAEGDDLADEGGGNTAPSSGDG
jgi:hypothetical protein